MRDFRLLRFASLIVLFSLAGCGGGDKTTKPIVPSDGLPAVTPQADTPAHLAQRLEATWESQVETEYAKLLTDDFRFHFSPASDPVLVETYGNNWKRSDEIEALTHLFHGFTNAESDTIPGANSIDVTLTGVQYAYDFEHPDSTAQYKKMVITSFNAAIEVPTEPEPSTFPISSRQELYLVRGDAAVLPAGSPADSSRWYVRRWEDLSTLQLFRQGSGHQSVANDITWPRESRLSRSTRAGSGRSPRGNSAGGLAVEPRHAPRSDVGIEGRQ